MSAPRKTVGMFYSSLGEGDEGLLDQLMLVVDDNLKSQFDKQRLSGTDYARVYTALFEAAMSTTTQYLIANLLIEDNQAKIQKEIELMDKQMEAVDQDIEKTKAEIEVLKLQPALTQAQIEKVQAEIAFLDAQKLMMDAQKEKIDKEIEFMNAKIRTEYANTIGSYADTTSLIGRQKALLQAQKLGFAGDIEAKGAKLHADFQSVLLSVSENPEQVQLVNEGTKTDANGLSFIKQAILNIP
jgi:chromosome segregation ATPase